MAGLAAGLVHVLCGADHLAAVAPLSLGKGKRGWHTGFEWGLGHCGGVLMIGLLALIFREVLPVDSISFWAERIVGITLIGIGAWGICKLFRAQTHQPPRTALGIGLLHGLAGSSHLLGVIPALLFPGRIEVCGYLIAFGAGTLAGMAGFSSLIAAAPARVYRPGMAVSASFALSIGCYWLFQ